MQPPPDSRRERSQTLLFVLAGSLGGCVAPYAVAPPVATDATAPMLADAQGQALSREAAASALHRLARLAGNAALARAFAASGAHAPVRQGNTARLLVDGPQTHTAMFEAIAAARREIHLETYILGPGEPGERLAGSLIERRAHGVQIRVLYDAVGSRATPKEYFQRLVAAGVAVCEFNPLLPSDLDLRANINNRDHRKLLVVDAQVGFTGGVNISAAYRSGSFSRRIPPTPEQGWRDTHVEVRGPVVADFQALFLAAWQTQGCQPAIAPDTEPAVESTTAHADGAPMRVVTADPRTGRSEFYRMLLAAIGNAQQRVWLTYAYFVPDTQLVSALGEAAHRGADVRLVLPGFSDFWPALHAGRTHYARLLAAGVRIFERHDALLHAKSAVIDSAWSAVGSSNLDWRSFAHNYEADLLVFDRAFAADLERLFERDQSAAREIEPALWDDRGLAPRLKEWLARRWEYLL